MRQVYVAKRARDDVVLAWGISRWDGHDREMSDRVSKFWRADIKDPVNFHVWMVPEKQKCFSAERMMETRRRRMEARIRKKYPLFADEMINEELKKSYFSVEECASDRARRVECLDRFEKEFWVKLPRDKQVFVCAGPDAEKKNGAAGQAPENGGSHAGS